MNTATVSTANRQFMAAVSVILAFSCVFSCAQLRADESGDPQKKTTLKVRLVSDENGNLSMITIDKMVVGPPVDGRRTRFDALNSIIRRRIVDSGGPEAAKQMEVEFECDYGLKYEHVISAITAVSGYREGSGPDAKVVKLIQQIKFTPPRKSSVATDNEDDQPKPASKRSDDDSDKAADQPAQGSDGKRVPLVISIEKSDDEFVAKVGDEVIGIEHPLDSFLARKCRILDERGISPKTLIVVIRAEEDVPTGIIQSVIELLQGHNFEKFSLRAKKKKNAS